MNDARPTRAVLVLALPLLMTAAAGLAPAAAATGPEPTAASVALPTAKAGLAAADAAARKWQADAVLTAIDTNTAQPDGRAYNWGYIYFSPKAKAKTLVMLDEEGKIDSIPTFTPGNKPLVGFVDSDVAIAAAVKAGMKTHGFGMKMSLTNLDRAEWFMSDMDYSYTVDAGSGRLLKKEKN